MRRSFKERSASDRAGLIAADRLVAFLKDHVLPGIGFETDVFWSEAAGILNRFAPENRVLLGIRDGFQRQIDVVREPD